MVEVLFYLVGVLTGIGIGFYAWWLWPRTRPAQCDGRDDA